LIEVKEGNTSFFVPVQDTLDQFPPGTAPVFYNPRMELNRDATVLLLSVIKPEEYLDAMGASGVRGLRAARECGIPVFINDRSREAFDLISLNTSRAGAEAGILNEDVHVLLSERRFDAVDLDPFGSPAPFTDSGIRGTKRYLMVTATDTAPLCGAHFRAGIRRYGAVPRNTEYHGEVGLRVLLGFMARMAARYDIGISPLFSFAREHYVRLHLRLSRGAASADRSLGHIGFILQCGSCFYRREEAGMVPGCGSCQECGEALVPVGPLWLGGVQDGDILDRMAGCLPGMGLGREAELGALIGMCRDELPTSSHYDYHRLAKAIRVSPPRIADLVERLVARGYPSGRTHYSGTGIRTTAPLPEIYRAIRSG
jgi:tRNA (guanine26-N2/guanine27-N2)-dimethyltransferase